VGRPGSRCLDRLQAAWYARRVTPLAALLAPVALLYRGAVALRRRGYRLGLFRSERLPVPVVVVGNITVGGSGKTPLTRALADALAARGWHPGIVSRGYGGTNAAPRAVAADDDPLVVGDEAPILAAAGHPVWISRDRPAAARALLAANPRCDVLLADDGLQHYALARDVEIAVIDASRGFGNGFMLPAGPLREPAARLDEVDAIVRLVAWGAPLPASGNRGRDSLTTHEPRPWRNLVYPERFPDLDAWRAGTVHAVAGTGHPQRFFDLVRALGFAPVCHPFPDHHAFVPGDLAYACADAVAVLMTEKDAVKCRTFADERCWYLPVRAWIDPALVQLVEERLRGSQAA
jgi:tetraacyldisaccharide 4'-kinase